MNSKFNIFNRNKSENIKNYSESLTDKSSNESNINIIDAKKWGVARKWFIVLICSFGSMNCTCLSSIFPMTTNQVMKKFNKSHEIVTLAYAMYILGIGLGPLFFSPISEVYGRRPLYVYSYLIFVALQFANAFANNIEALIIPRFFIGFFGAAFLSVAGGTISDLFEPSQLGHPMLVFSMSPFLGPSIGPIMGGFINYNLNWRWTFHIMIMWSFTVWLLSVFFLQETYPPVLLRKSNKLNPEIKQNDKLKNVIKNVLYSWKRPLGLLAFEPIVLGLCIYSSILMSILYLFFGVFSLVFTETHDFNLQQVGLTFIGILVGVVSNWIIQPFCTTKIYYKLVRKNGNIRKPEFRLVHAMLGGILSTGGLFWFAFTIKKSIHWIIPIIGSTFYSAGMVLVFTGVLTYLVEGYPKYSASVVSANVFLRCTIATAFPLFGTQMYTNLGFDWATALLAFLTAACVPMPFIFYLYGEKLRARGHYVS